MGLRVNLLPRLSQLIIQIVDKSQDYESVMEMLDSYTKETKSTTNCREIFNKRNQKKGERFSNFLTSVQNPIKDCAYADLEDSMLRDRLVRGVADPKLSQGLRSKPKLSLEEAINMCKAAELAALESGEDSTYVDSLQQRSNRPDIRKCYKAKKPYYDHNRRKPWGQNKPHGGPVSGRGQHAPGKKFLCSQCGTWHVGRNCPAFGHTCRNCNRPNHYPKYCTSSSSIG